MIKEQRSGMSWTPNSKSANAQLVVACQSCHGTSEAPWNEGGNEALYWCLACAFSAGSGRIQLYYPVSRLDRPSACSHAPDGVNRRRRTLKEDSFFQGLEEGTSKLASKMQTKRFFSGAPPTSQWTRPDSAIVSLAVTPSAFQIPFHSDRTMLKGGAKRTYVYICMGRQGELDTHRPGSQVAQAAGLASLSKLSLWTERNQAWSSTFFESVPFLRNNLSFLYQCIAQYSL